MIYPVRLFCHLNIVKKYIELNDNFYHYYTHILLSSMLLKNTQKSGLNNRQAKTTLLNDYA